MSLPERTVPERRNTDERRGSQPRRAGDVRLHYARENLLATALAYAQALNGLNVDPTSAMGKLKMAATVYRKAETEVYG